MEPLTTLLAIFLLIALCYVCSNLWSREPFFTNWPVLGMVPTILSHLSCILEVATQALQKSTNGTFIFKGPWFWGFDFLITTDPMNVHYILNKNNSNYHRGSEFKQIMEHIGDGIFVADPDSWKVQRNILHSLLRNKAFAMAVERISYDKIVNGMFVVLDLAAKSKTELDMQDLFQRFMFDTTCKYIVGCDPNYLSVECTENAHLKALRVLQEVSLFRHVVPGNIWRMLKWLQIGIEKKSKKARESVDHFVYECISKNRQQISKQSETNHEYASKEEDQDFNLIKCFLLDTQETNPDIQALKKSDKFLRDTVVSLFSAGVGPTAAGLSWFLWLVATHPSVEEKILEEIKNTCQEKQHNEFHKAFNEKELDKLIYLHATICESLRLYPPVPYIPEVSKGADSLPSGDYIDKNTRVVYCPYAMGRMEAIWGKDHMEFKPERWINSQKGHIQHVPSYKFIAFGTGPKACIGKSLAMQQTKAVAVAVIWNYNIKVVDNHPVCPETSMILYMKYGLKVKVSKRDVAME